MSIQQQVTADLQRALKNQDQQRLSLLRVVLGEFNRLGKHIDDATAIARIKKMAADAQQLCKDTEASILNEYLPQQLDANELTAAVAQIIAANNFYNSRDIGAVMKMLKAEYGAAIDGRQASKIILQQLQTAATQQP